MSKKYDNQTDFIYYNFLPKTKIIKGITFMPVGNKVVGKLNTQRIMSIVFSRSIQADKYFGLTVEIININKGLIDSYNISFKDMIKSPLDVLTTPLYNSENIHVCKRDKFYWYISELSESGCKNVIKELGKIITLYK